MMNMGFEKASESFSTLMGRKVSFAHSNTVLIQKEQEFPNLSGEQGQLIILTTEIIGGLSGRSYLILSEQEQAEICACVSPSRPVDQKFREALLMEIDNIVSACVISQLANQLSIEVYGDVPHVQYIRADEMQAVLKARIPQETASNILICTTTFLLDNHQHVHPQFIWKLSTKIFDLINMQTVN